MEIYDGMAFAYFDLRFALIPLSGCDVIEIHFGHRFDNGWHAIKVRPIRVNAFASFVCTRTQRNTDSKSSA